jgi:guanyl-specific ribonuclease Sa
MNARLYDAALGRFLSPDPYVQAPDFSQSFNRYSYCVNNPLRYTDENGKWFGIDDLIGAVIGGTINWVSNGCKFSWEGLSYFGAGAVAGWLTVNCPLAATWINAGLSAANNTLSQGFNNGWSNIDFGQVGNSAIMGAATSYAGSKIGGLIGKPLDKLTGGIESPLLKQMIVNESTGMLTGGVIGGAVALNNNQNFWDGAWSGAKMGMVTGAINGLGAAAQYSIDHQVNMLTGNPTKVTVNYNGNTIDLSSTVERIQNGEAYPHRNDGSVFYNKEQLLPQASEGYYHEYVHPTPGVLGPGAQRIVTGTGGEMWYSPDHYKTFIPIKW